MFNNLVNNNLKISINFQKMSDLNANMDDSIDQQSTIEASNEAEIEEDSNQNFHNVHFSNCYGDMEDSGFEATQMIKPSRDTSLEEGGSAGRIPYLLSSFVKVYDSNDVEKMVSEVKACERGLSDVETQLLEISDEIRCKESRITDLEGRRISLSV